MEPVIYWKSYFLQVLFLELRLPPSGDPSAPGPGRTLGPSRRPAGRGRGKQQFSTNKDILEKLRPLHALPGIVLEFRRISNALSKVKRSWVILIYL
jgi:DNA polymerase theta